MRHVANSAAPRGARKIRLSVEADPTKPEAVALAQTMSGWLEEHGALAASPAEADIQVVLGGDGMVVRAARSACNVPVLGIDFGQLGFLAHVPPTRWEARLRQVLAGRYQVRDDPTLSLELERGGHDLASLWAVQDLVFHAYVVPKHGQQMARLETYVDGKFFNVFPGDGLIVATSPGSSAYNLSAGGPVLTPGGGLFAITPICAHTPIKGSFAVPEGTSITVVHTGRFPINVCADGQESFDEYSRGDIAHIRADPRRFRLVTFKDLNFYDRFRQRFNYRIRPGYRASGIHHEHPER